jgi:arylsulfatase A-like enzyme
MYEESFRTPFIIRWPGRIEPGSVSNAMSQNIDFAPTMLDIAGIKPPARMHGESLLPVIEGQGKAPEGWRESVYYRYYESHGPHTVPKHDGMRNERWKLIWFPEVDPDGDGPRPQGCYELYDLDTDPDELQDVSAVPQNAAILFEGIEEIERLRIQYGPE